MFWGYMIYGTDWNSFDCLADRTIVMLCLFALFCLELRFYRYLILGV